MKLHYKTMILGMLCMAMFANTLSAQNSGKAIQNFSKIKSKFVGKKFKDGDYKIKDSGKLQIKPIESATLKKLNLEGAIVNVVWGTLLLEYWGKCNVFLPNSEDCEDCILIWYDYNQDQLVQPRKELRAICQKSLRACGIIVKERPSCK